MSAETLRRAAALMRERAEATQLEADWGRALSKLGRRTPKGQHATGMSPAFALAVAHFLSTEAAHAERGAVDWKDPDTVSRNALAVARAYLGEAA